MAKVYMIDSENVGASWTPLLSAIKETDKMFVFYTERSPYISYDDLLLILSFHDIPVFIKCHEGKNGLDFQLVSELGFKLCEDPDSEYIIVSDDTGYDAAIHYWRSKNYKVRRMGKKLCRVTAQKQESAGISPADADEIQEPIVEEMPQEEESAASQQDFGETPQDSLRDSQSRRQLRDRRRRHRREYEKGYVTDDTAQGAETADEFVTDESMSEKSVTEEIAAENTVTEEYLTGFALTEGSVAQEPCAQEPEPEESAMQESEPEKSSICESEVMEPVAEEAVAHGEDEKEKVQEQSTARDLDELYRELLDIAVKCDSPSPEKDAQCIGALFYSLQMSDLFTVNTALKMLLGDEPGNRIYRELKENKKIREKLDGLYVSSQKERFDCYVQIVMNQNDDLNYSWNEISDFLYSIPRKNLNSIHSAMVRKFGREKGNEIYMAFKPHIKVLNKI